MATLTFFAAFLRLNVFVSQRHFKNHSRQGLGDDGRVRVLARQARLGNRLEVAGSRQGRPEDHRLSRGWTHPGKVASEIFVCSNSALSSFDFCVKSCRQILDAYFGDLQGAETKKTEVKLGFCWPLFF